MPRSARGSSDVVAARISSEDSQYGRSVDSEAIRSWFDDYLRVFAACGRNDSDDLHALLDYYGVPLVVCTDDAARALMKEDDVVGFARQQIEGMRAANYDHTSTLSSDVVVLNKTGALHTAAFSRHRLDGSEIGRLRVTYLITDGPDGLRISALAVHTA
jgi:hypothetical protein